MTNERTFYDLGISPGILTALLKLNFKTPTPIQEKSIPVAIEGKDLMGIAQTGTGKTLAFGVPMIQFVLRGAGKGLVVLPTRELALQVNEAFSKIGNFLGLKTAVLIGGENFDRQFRALKNHPHIIIGTPGRIIDHLEQRTLNLSETKMLVLDEADRMLDMGFAQQLRKILERVPKERQTMLFSATMPEVIIQIAKSYMKLPIRVEIAPPGTAIEKITQELFFVAKQDKPRLLEKLLLEYRGSVLIFIRTKFGVKRIARAIKDFGHSVTEIHSNRSLNQRKEALDGFKRGKYRVLVATDIAARGIDVSGITLVLNYDLPMNAQDYVHRIGRTGRAGAGGHAIAFATPEQKQDVRDIERLMRMTLPQSALPELPPAKVPHFEQPSQTGGGGFRGAPRRKAFHKSFRQPGGFRPRR